MTGAGSEIGGIEDDRRCLRVATLDEDPTCRHLIRHWLKTQACAVVDVGKSSQLDGLLETLPDIVCLDVSFDQGRGLSLLEEIHTLRPGLPVVALGPSQQAETAVAAMRAGARDYVVKPLEQHRFLAAFERVSRQHGLRRPPDASPDVWEGGVLRGGLAGPTKAVRELDALLARVVEKDVAICIDAERGAGADLVAAAIHRGCTRQAGPFVELDCGAISADEQLDVLFGKESGTAAPIRGAFERANGGILFLRQVGALGQKAQVLLAQCMATKMVQRVGGHEPVPVNVRIVAAHEGDLRVLLERGQFREELYFRIAVFPVRIPPLRERKDDIPFLTGHFLRKLAPDSGLAMAPEALQALLRYPWPGNLRELEHVLHRASLRSKEKIIELGDLPLELRQALASEGPISSRRARDDIDFRHFPHHEIVPLRELERRAIEHALRVTGGSVALAARKLGIGRATLYRRIASLDLSLSVA